jgi:hypothetical protein
MSEGIDADHIPLRTGQTSPLCIDLVIVVKRVRGGIGLMGETGLGPGLILPALVDHLAIIHVELVEVGDPSTGDGGDMQVLDAMQVGQRKGKAFSFFGRDKLIDIDRMNRLLTLVIATTVAKGLPASGKTGEKNISHDSHP